jgi:hypothetical protein
MPFEEKVTWVNALVSALVPAIYFAKVMGQAGRVPVTAIAYQGPMLTAIGAAIVLTIVGSILAGIGTGISAKITGSGSVDDIGRKDERDVNISRRGELIGYYVSSAGVVGVLGLTMLEYEYFWIANGIYSTFVVASLASSVVKLVAYRRGF